MNNNPVYVISVDGEPLMPTFRYGKVRHLLKNKEAKVIKRDPFFTIQLLKETTTFIQPLKAGMDIGETIGLSVVSGTKEILSAELETRSKNIPSKMEKRRMYRRTRRNKLRYRKARFNNRGASKSTCKHCGGNAKSGKMFCSKCLREVNGVHQMYSSDSKTYNEKRLAPSVRHLIDTHFKIKDEINTILPLTNKEWVIEKTKFDIQKMKDIDITGVAYQQGDKFGFSSLRDYVLDRDNHICQNPNCIHKRRKTDIQLKNDNPYLKRNIVLHIHHIVYRSQGGTDKPSNLVTLCNRCHTQNNHQPGNLLWQWSQEKKKINSNYESATKMNVVASAFNDYNDVSFTVGSKTKRKRQLVRLDKTHSNDAFSICLDDNLFELVTNSNGLKSVILKSDVKINKIETPLILTQTNGRENSRRSLQTFTDAKYIDIRDGSIKTGKELERETNKRTVINNNRIYRGRKVEKGKIVIRKGIKKFPNNSIVSFKKDNKNLILECGGMTGNNIYVKNYHKKTLAAKTYNAKIICKRKGILK